MNASEKEACCVVSRLCYASPGSTPERRMRTECFSCGEPVCTAPGCSIRTPYLSYGTQRVCTTCLEMRHGDAPVLAVALRKLYAREAVADGHEAGGVQALVEGYMNLLAP